MTGIVMMMTRGGIFLERAMKRARGFGGIKHLLVPQILVGITEVDFELGFLDEFAPHGIAGLDGGVRVLEENEGVRTLDTEAVDFDEGAVFSEAEA